MSVWRYVLSGFAVAAFVFLSGSSDAAIFRVGNGINCTHSRLVDAIASAEANGTSSDEIRLSQNNNENSFVGTRFIIDQSLEIIGGFATCGSNTASFGVRTSILGSTYSAFSIANQSSNRAIVTLRNLDLNGSKPKSGGGAVAVFGHVEMTLSNTALRNNLAERGGGVYVDGMAFAQPAQLNLLSSEIINNTASKDGGGVYCARGASIRMDAASNILENKAGGFGGGAMLDRCVWRQQGGRIGKNVASDGGAVFARTSSKIYIEMGLRRREAVSSLVDSNIASRGAGIALTGAGTTLDARGLAIIGNGDPSPNLHQTAVSTQGVALWVGEGAFASLQRDLRCIDKNYSCSVISGNHGIQLFTTLPSIVKATDGGRIFITQTEVALNTSKDEGAVRSSGSIFDAGRFQGGSDESLIELHNSRIVANTAVAIFGAVRYRYIGVGGGSIDGALLTIDGNSIETFLAGAPDFVFGEPIHPSHVPVRLRASILNEEAPLMDATRYVLAPDGALDCLISRQAIGVPTTRSMIIDPFLDVASVPLSNSPAIDFCSDENLPLMEMDLLGNPRPIRVPDHFGFYGIVDLGAIEIVPPVIGLE